MTLVKVKVFMVFKDGENNQYDDLRHLYFLVDDETADWAVSTYDLHQDWLEEEERFLTKIHKALHEMPDYNDCDNWYIGKITKEGQFSVQQGRTVFNS